MNLAQQLALFADRLRDLSALGLHYADNIHERHRYEAVQDVAVELMAVATGEQPEDFAPLRANVLAHPTPFAGGDAAIFDNQDRILLIRRSDNHKWAMPGGALEVGETPAEGVEREALEETGVRCRAVALAGIFDSRLSHSVSRHHLYHIVFLCEPTDTSALGQGSHKEEVLDVQWFAETEIPSDLDEGHRSRIPEILRFRKGKRAAYFDR